MAVPFVFAKYQLSKATKLIDLTSDTLKVVNFSALTLGTLQADAQFMDAVFAAGTEATGGGYTTGGVALGSVTYTQSGLGYVLDAADTTIGSGTNTAYSIICDTTPGSNAANPAIMGIDWGGTIALDTIRWNASGLLKDLSV